MERRPTIIDVAREAGVSKSTVSLVLQNSPLVKLETRQLIQAKMAELGYVYNRSAANLRSANTSLIGVVINDLLNPFFTEFATFLEMELSARGYIVVIANTNENPQIQAQVVAAMIEHGVSALIISPAYGDEAKTFDAILRAKIPTMQVLRKVESRTHHFPFAAPDYVTGSVLATEHLVQQGAKHIAFIGGLTERAVTQERRQGYFSVLREYDLEPLVIDGRASRAFGREVTARLKHEYPNIDAVICFNDLLALGMLSEYARAGYEVGQQFRIVGFDDIEDSAHTYPSLSSIRCDIANFGKRIASTVLEWLENGVIPVAEVRTPVQLVIRESSKGFMQ